MAPVSVLPNFRVDIVVDRGSVRVVNDYFAVDGLESVRRQVVGMMQFSDRRVSVGSVVPANDYNGLSLPAVTWPTT